MLHFFVLQYKALLLRTYLVRILPYGYIPGIGGDKWFTWTLWGRVCIYANAAINPLIYSGFNQRFREELKTVMLAPCFKNHSDEIKISKITQASK